MVAIDVGSFTSFAHCLIFKYAEANADVVMTLVLSGRVSTQRSVKQLCIHTAEMKQPGLRTLGSIFCCNLLLR